MGRFFKLTYLAAMVLCLVNPVTAEEKVAQAPAKEEVAAKQVSGLVSGISANFIAVEYGTGEKGGSLEMAFDLNKDVKIENKKSLKEIGVGDTVSVDYTEITRTEEEGKKVSSRRVAVTIAFLRPAPKAAETGVFDSKNSEE